MPTTVIEARPTPVRKRATNKPMGPITKALSNENPANQEAVRIRARFLPRRSDIQPPMAEPANMPKKVDEVMKPIVEMERCQFLRIAGAAKAKVFIDPNSKKNTKLRSIMIRR